MIAHFASLGKHASPTFINSEDVFLVSETYYKVAIPFKNMQCDVRRVKVNANKKRFSISLLALSLVAVLNSANNRS